jgi:hypothetical protein
MFLGTVCRPCSAKQHLASGRSEYMLPGMDAALTTSRITVTLTDNHTMFNLTEVYLSIYGSRERARIASRVFLATPLVRAFGNLLKRHASPLNIQVSKTKKNPNHCEHFADILLNVNLLGVLLVSLGKLPPEELMQYNAEVSYKIWQIVEYFYSRVSVRLILPYEELLAISTGSELLIVTMIREKIQKLWHDDLLFSDFGVEPALEYVLCSSFADKMIEGILSDTSYAPMLCCDALTIEYSRIEAKVQNLTRYCEIYGITGS